MTKSKSKFGLLILLSSICREEKKITCRWFRAKKVFFSVKKRQSTSLIRHRQNQPFLELSPPCIGKSSDFATALSVPAWRRRGRSWRWQSGMRGEWQGTSILATAPEITDAWCWRSLNCCYTPRWVCPQPVPSHLCQRRRCTLQGPWQDVLWLLPYS